LKFTLCLATFGLAAAVDRLSLPNTGKSDGGKTCAKAFVHCGILKPVKA
jgi:hypothetical protein